MRNFMIVFFSVSFGAMIITGFIVFMSGMLLFGEEDVSFNYPLAQWALGIFMVGFVATIMMGVTFFTTKAHIGGKALEKARYNNHMSHLRFEKACKTLGIEAVHYQRRKAELERPIVGFYWNDPNHIQSNDYLIGTLSHINDEMCHITYNGAISEAEVPYSEIEVIYQEEK